MKICHELLNLAYPIKLEQAANRTFRVTYGKQVRSNLSYGEAAAEYGACIMHALACDSLLDNSEGAESAQGD